MKDYYYISWGKHKISKEKSIFFGKFWNTFKFFLFCGTFIYPAEEGIYRL